ncbi:MAG TPA: TolC family protein [Acidobacteriaceae bacterium]|nr:TolC family protein [Acidobacteriaceae bacterium]
MNKTATQHVAIMAGASRNLNHPAGTAQAPVRSTVRRAALVCWACILCCPHSRAQQMPGPVAPSAPVSLSNLSRPQATTPPVSISLAQAQQRALKIEPSLLTAQAAYATSRYNRTIARSGLLPQATLIGSYLFTESNGTLHGATLPGPGPVFVANNQVHEYITQFEATENMSLAAISKYRATSAAQLQAEAEQDIAQRGLYLAVTQFYYSVLAADRKLKAAREAEQESQRFVDLTKKLEAAREVAHADVLKAELQLEQRQRDHSDAALTALQARESLGVLLFPDPATPYVLSDPLNSSMTLPDDAEIKRLANFKNPELQSATAGLQAANADVLASRAEYLPTFNFAYNYGIDAPQIQRIGPGGERYLGYSAFAGVNVPVWDWFATHSHVKQSEIRQHLAKANLTLAQRQLTANIDAASNEVKTASASFTSLLRSVDQAKESLHLSTLRYQAGEATVVEVVDAQNTYLTTETLAADGAVRYHVAVANLERLTGKLP